jgi:hypothetical protein
LDAGERCVPPEPQPAATSAVTAAATMQPITRGRRRRAVILDAPPLALGASIARCLACRHSAAMPTQPSRSARSAGLGAYLRLDGLACQPRKATERGNVAIVLVARYNLRTKSWWRARIPSAIVLNRC